MLPSAAERERLAGLLQRGEYAHAEREIRLHLNRLPSSGELWKGLAIARRAQGKEALDAHRRAAQLLPADAEAHHDLGVALLDAGQPGESVLSFQRALDVGPDDARTRKSLGEAEAALGRYEAAASSYRRALQLAPEYRAARLALGTVYRTLGRWQDAVSTLEQAVVLHPESAEIRNNLGNLHTELGQFAEAEACFREALRIDADFAQAHSNLLLLRHLQPTVSAADKFDEARRFGAWAARRARPYAAWRGAPVPDRRLRVGLVSGDLRRHPVGYFLDSVTESLAGRFAGDLELIAYATTRAADDLTARLRSRCSAWCPVESLPDEVLAGRIHDDGIDILIDLAGHTAFNRLPVFAWKPAPVQVSWLGYFASTGLEAIDAVLADPWSVTDTDQETFSERLCCLPESRLCFTVPEPSPPVAGLPALTHGDVTFGCFNNLAKLNDEVLGLWAQILAAQPGSRLLLKAAQLADPVIRDRLARRVARLGVAAERLILEGPEPREAYLKAYARVDLALDPFPFTGATTSLEALWMGVPVLTLAGSDLLGRQGVSLLSNVGLHDWVARSPQEYVARALDHGRDLAALAALRAGLRDRVRLSPVCDAPRFAGHLRATLRGLWARWCAART